MKVARAVNCTSLMIVICERPKFSPHSPPNKKVVTIWGDASQFANIRVSLIKMGMFSNWGLLVNVAISLPIEVGK